MGQAKRRAEGSSTSVRHGVLRRSNSWANAAKVLLTAVIVVALSGVSVAAYAVWGLVQGVQTVDLVAPAENPEAVGAGVQSLDGALTVLLVGSDSRAGQSLDDGEEGERARGDPDLEGHVGENRDGDAAADMIILLKGVIALEETDFIL